MQLMALGAVTICLCLMSTLAAVGRASTLAQEDSPAARKYDEFAYARPYSECDITARLDDFYQNGLGKEPGSRGYIIFYQGKKRTVRHTHVAARGYLIDARGVDAERVEAVFGGYRDDVMMELWLVPPGAEALKPTPSYFPRKGKRR